MSQTTTTPTYALRHTPAARWRQQKLTQHTSHTVNLIPNIEPAGDPLSPRPGNAIRFAYQNIRGISERGLTLPDEIAALDSLQIDLMGMSETNRPWHPDQRDTYDAMMTHHFRQSRTVFTAAPSSDRTSTYQPGGNLLTINGRTTGRIVSTGSDRLGRFCWFALRGHRDEGVLVITAYRVCQQITDNPGPHTSFSQQFIALREQGVKNPNPRRQILTDLTSLIHSHRLRGFRPVLMMDANGALGSDKDLQSFLIDTSLCDPFHDRFGSSNRTCITGSSRIDYIFMDAALCPSILHIGYLGTHDGALSDHVVGYVDFDEAALFQGVINRPLPAHSREILIEQEDKVLEFLLTFHTLLDSHSLDARVAKLAEKFASLGPSIENITQYNSVYGQFLELARGASHKVGRKKYGYARSSTLTHAGMLLVTFKQLLDCRLRGSPLSPALLRRFSLVGVDPTDFDDVPVAALRLKVRQQRQHLWECQKRGEDLRQDWLETEARQRAQAAGDEDWERRLKGMRRRIRESAINRKLTSVVKGRRGMIDRIQVPTHTWFFSPSSSELFRYDNGVFEAYPRHSDHIFHPHHTLKVLPSDARIADVSCDDDGFWHLCSTSPTPPNLWREITSQHEIEALLLARNQRHLEQTQREGGRSTQAPISLLRASGGYNPMATAVLNGEPTDYDLTPAMAAFFSALAITPTERILSPVLGTITSTDFQEMFRRSRERTSSDPRTLNYTIWKCLARSDRVAGFLSILLSLPFTYGFVNTHWTHMTDFMLEKKPGIRQIHTLRIIGKVAAEFNTCLKFLIGKQARDNFERADPCDDQHGFRPHRSSADAAMIKLLTYECARMQKSTVATFQNDMSGHFDRMWPDMTSLFATKYGVSRNIMNCLNRTISKLSRNVETALGISDTTYSQATSLSRLGGMVQGKADVPQFSTQQMDVMLKAHQRLAPGLQIVSPSLRRSIQRTSLSYADDTDGLISEDTSPTTSISAVVEQLRQNAQGWSDLADICGGLIALHKCNWHLMAWEISSGHLTLAQTSPTPLLMADCHGSVSTIQFLSPNQPNIGLGFHLCPNGDQTPHFNSLLDSVRRICCSAASAHLDEHETRILLRQRLIPKITYALHGSSFSEKQCNMVNSVIRMSFLPGLRLNRHFPSAILYGPLDFGGMEFPEIYTLQDQVQLDYLMKQLRWGHTVANDFMVTLDSVQLCSGYCEPILSSTTGTIDYLEQSYIIDLRRRLAELGADIWVETAWYPRLQRVGDASIMETFNSIPGISRAKLRRANAVRLFLRVVTIADLCDVQGTHIRDGMLQGDWQAGSDLRWPFQPNPPKPFWATFRWCLRQSFCTTTCPHQPASYSMRLDTPLGTWHAVPRNTWFPAYRHNDRLYWRRCNDATLHMMTPSKTSGFFHFASTTTTLPLDSHPIVHQQVGESIWTQRPYFPSQDSYPILQPGHIVENTLCHPTGEVITIGCDGSVYLDKQTATCAWIIHDADGSFASACFLLSGISSLSSYRSELEGIFRSLSHIEYLGMRPSEVNLWCDNEAAVDRCSSKFWTPSDMIQPEADILLAIQAVRHHLSLKGTQITCRHIYSHQDSRRRPAPAVLDEETHDEYHQPRSSSAIDMTHITYSRHHDSLDLPTRINIACDKLATATSQAAMAEGIPPELPPALQPPFPGSVAVLRIDGTCITSHQRRPIHWERRASPLRDYCMAKYGWSRNTFESIDWDAIRRVRKKGTATQLIKTSKILHDWLPVMHMLSHIEGSTQCPGCTHSDETITHLLHCPHPLLRAKREEIVTALRKKGLRRRLPRAFLNALSDSILDNAIPGQGRDECTQLHLAIHSQSNIGWGLMLRGFLSKQWTTALHSLGVTYPTRAISWTIQFLWYDYIDVIWRSRNDILHNTLNENTKLAESQMQDRLHWFLDNRSCLSHGDWYLLTFTHTDIPLMTLRTQKELLRLLNRAHTVYTRELLTLEKGQSRITDYFTPHKMST